MSVAFRGAKAALYFDGKILVYQRDDKPGLNYSGMWDLPGGGREGNETPAECVIREIQEEFTINLSEDAFTYAKEYPSTDYPGERAWFLVGSLTINQKEAIKLGDEGQGFNFWTPEQIIESDEFVPFLRVRLRKYRDETTTIA
jgi:8-oxo-dGTP diphosphatase